jgi:hypothetical protein
VDVGWGTVMAVSGGSGGRRLSKVEGLGMGEGFTVVDAMGGVLWEGYRDAEGGGIVITREGSWRGERWIGGVAGFQVMVDGVKGILISGGA